MISATEGFSSQIQTAMPRVQSLPEVQQQNASATKEVFSEKEQAAAATVEISDEAINAAKNDPVSSYAVDKNESPASSPSQSQAADGIDTGKAELDMNSGFITNQE